MCVALGKAGRVGGAGDLNAFGLGLCLLFNLGHTYFQNPQVHGGSDTFCHGVLWHREGAGELAEGALLAPHLEGGKGKEGEWSGEVNTVLQGGEGLAEIIYSRPWPRFWRQRLDTRDGFRVESLKSLSIALVGMYMCPYQMACEVVIREPKLSIHLDIRRQVGKGVETTFHPSLWIAD
jgi:hypothetical protein